MAEVSEPEVLDALDQAHRVQLIEPVNGGTFRFRHSLTRDAIVSDLLPPERASRSERAAAAIEQTHPDLPGSWCDLVAELRAAAGQPVEAAGLLLTAGSRAIGQGALTSAIACLQDAQKLLAGTVAAESMLDIEIAEALVEALALSGDVGQLGLLAEDLIGRLEAAGAEPRREALIRLRAVSTRPEDNHVAAAEHLKRARAIADHLRDAELVSRVDAVAARYALATGDLDQAEELATRSLTAADHACPASWAAEVAVESLDVIGRRERIRDLDAARHAFERAYQIADQHSFGVWRITLRHELATNGMLADGATDRLREVREAAVEAGLISTVTMIDLQLANLLSLGQDLDAALAAARLSERGATQVSARRAEAMSICLQGLVFAIRTDIDATDQAIARAEAILPGAPEVLVQSRGQVAVLSALFRDDPARAAKESAAALAYREQAIIAPERGRGFYSPAQAPLVARGRSWGLAALLQAVTGTGGRRAIEQAVAVGAVASWNRGCLAYAEAVLEGRPPGACDGAGGGRQRGLRAVCPLVESPGSAAGGAVRSQRWLGPAGRLDAGRRSRV